MSSHPVFKLAPLSCFLFEISLEALSAEGACESEGGRRSSVLTTCSALLAAAAIAAAKVAL